MPQINYHFYVHTISTCIFVNKYIYLHGSGHEQGSSPLEAKYDRAAEHTTANGESLLDSARTFVFWNRYT